MAETRVLYRPRVLAVESTHAGMDPAKQTNEDALGSRPTRLGFLAVVCDGMGGHVGGREASHAAVREVLALDEGAEPSAALVGAIERAHAAVRRIPSESGSLDGPGRPGSTVVALLLTPEAGFAAHVGDSRLYRVAKGQVEQLTLDHTKVRYLVEMGKLRPEEAAHHPEANQIVRALGIGDRIEVELRAFSFSAGDLFILASDGFTDLVRTEELPGLVASLAFERIADELVALANRRGGHDNISVVVVQALEGAEHATVVGNATGATVPLAGPPSAGARTEVQHAHPATEVMVHHGASSGASMSGPPSRNHSTERPRWDTSPQSSRGQAPKSARKSSLPVVLVAFAVLVVVLVSALAYTFVAGERHRGHKTPSFVGKGSTAEPRESATSSPTSEIVPTIPPLPPLDAGPR